MQLWLDIVGNRVRLLDSGEVREFIQSSSDLQAIASDFREAFPVRRDWWIHWTSQAMPRLLASWRNSIQS